MPRTCRPTPPGICCDTAWAPKPQNLVHGYIGAVTVKDSGVDVVIADEGTLMRLIAAGIFDPEDGTGETTVVTAIEVVDSISACLRERQFAKAQE